MARSFVHLINPVCVPPDNQLYHAQQVTFKAIENAWHSRGNLRVQLRTAQYQEDHRIIPPFFSPTPDLTRSVLDTASFILERKLPFLNDVLERILKYSSAEYAIFTNVDIIPSPDFYVEINALIESGHTAFSINRRTVAKFPNSPDRLDEILAQDGKPHPGHDCFIFPRELIERFFVGRIIVGAPWIGFILLAHIACHGGNTKVFEDLYLTRHLGDDVEWLGKEHLQYRNHNSVEAAWILGLLQRQHGTFVPQSYLGQHVLLARQQVNAIAPGSTGKYYDTSHTNRLIFCINPGRSGSEYLKRLLGSALDVTAFHEPEPTMSGPFVNMVMAHPQKQTIEQRRIKAHAIQRILNRLPPGQVYAETSHMFIKTFYDVILDAFPSKSITVIILRRDPTRVLKSFVSMGYFSDKNQAWPSWMHRVPSANSFFKPIDGYETMDSYDRSISYLLDIEARAQRFQEQFPSCKVVEVCLEDLQTVKEVANFFESLGIMPTPYTRGLVGVPVNVRETVKSKVNVDTSLACCRERFQRYLERHKRARASLAFLDRLIGEDLSRCS